MKPNPHMLKFSTIREFPVSMGRRHIKLLATPKSSRQSKSITGSFLCGALSTLAMFKNHLPEVELDGEELDHNPMNLFYRPAYLNEKGKRYRKIALISIFVFLASVITRNFL